ncbi:hypothetical protein DPMN_019751 [Dreissena polymorpha]|uniref:Uncharacterized protein n=1 Tax=Dreissena polymorpha TaxID=45954 RepID=A0A9D4H897_DREPO|nr:hypothetical protein DPMN_043602 [Dreissena polymorpha]KAH3737042.1 hypothetical protein DPMN_043618 [Dreissena polymorpha]KAH3829350.1 hypothetical protein DPMN_131346 [Dreissena polymorpha]KAH3829407.1 hypothetical protein DPMN_131403 [Dreissena polymorpha]KAH3829423.1 hypothetical protein DPMN_131419 [Dreissena polymorpha]
MDHYRFDSQHTRGSRRRSKPPATADRRGPTRAGACASTVADKVERAAEVLAAARNASPR